MPEIPTSWMAGEPDTYSIESITALDNSALNELAAKLRTLRHVCRSTNDWIWEDALGNFYDEIFLPATDRNQSRELLQWAMTQKDAVFSVHIEHSFKRVDVAVPDLATQDSSGRMLFDREFTIEGNDARAETIAFCAAMLAINGRLQ